jgi:hypothetical protein
MIYYLSPNMVSAFRAKVSVHSDGEVILKYIVNGTKEVVQHELVHPCDYITDEHWDAFYIVLRKSFKSFKEYIIRWFYKNQKIKLGINEADRKRLRNERNFDVRIDYLGDIKVYGLPTYLQKKVKNIDDFLFWRTIGNIDEWTPKWNRDKMLLEVVDKRLPVQEREWYQPKFSVPDIGYFAEDDEDFDG